MSNNKLIIGTAQFIKHYGIFRKNQKQFNNFLGLFKNKNITFDTSPTYSSVEKFIGRNFKNKKISSKLPSLQNIPSKRIEEKINFFINQTLKDTQCKKIDYYLVHDENDLIKKDAKKIFYILEKFKKKKIISKIGVSIYDFSKLERIIDRFKLDVVQVPFNIIDRRLIKFYKKNKKKLKNIKIHIRSVFLQGLLLADYNLAKRKINNRQSLNVLFEYFNWCDKSKLKKIQICLNFLNSNRFFNNLVVGFDNVAQYKDFSNYYKNSIKIYPKKIFTDNNKLVNPNHWI